MSVLAVLATAFALSAFDKAPSENQNQIESMILKLTPTEQAAAASSYYIYPSGGTTYNGDTITNATNDTVDIPDRLLNDRNWAWTITATNISGTSSVIAIVQEASTTGAASTAIDWDEIGRDTFAPGGSATVSDWIRGEHTTGFRHRLILDGSGTQSTRVQTKFVAKLN